MSLVSPFELNPMDSLNQSNRCSNIKTGPLVLDDMKIRYFSADRTDFQAEMILSIIRVVTWLQENVLEAHPEKGHFLRKKLSHGIEFTDEMNSYLISSYRHWIEVIGKGNIPENLTVNLAIRHCVDPSCHKCSKLQFYLDMLEL